MKLRFARSATKHRISKASSRFVIERCDLWIELPPPIGAIDRRDKRLIFLGDDEDGRALEIMAVRLNEDELLVIHAMELRARFRNEYEETKRWRD